MKNNEYNELGEYTGGMTKLYWNTGDFTPDQREYLFGFKPDSLKKEKVNEMFINAIKEYIKDDIKEIEKRKIVISSEVKQLMDFYYLKSLEYQYGPNSDDIEIDGRLDTEIELDELVDTAIKDALVEKLAEYNFIPKSSQDSYKEGLGFNFVTEEYIDNTKIHGTILPKDNKNNVNA